MGVPILKGPKYVPTWPPEECPKEDKSNPQYDKTVTKSEDGKTVAIGGFQNDSAAANAGHVRVFRWDEATWTPVGSDIMGDSAGEHLGEARIAMSSDGRVLAIGAPGNDSNGGGSGATKIFH